MSRRLPAATFQDGLEWLSWFGGWHDHGVWMPLEHWSERDGRRTDWTRLQDPGLLTAWVSSCDHEARQVLLGLPRERFGGGVAVASLLWVMTEGGEQTKRLQAFRPLPSMVLRVGSGSLRLSFWALESALRSQDVERANKRLAYSLGAVQKHADPDRLEIPAPGTCVREGRTRPAPVTVSRLSVDSCGWDIVGRLKDPPDADAWRDRQQGANSA